MGTAMANWVKLTRFFGRTHGPVHVNMDTACYIYAHAHGEDSGTYISFGANSGNLHVKEEVEEVLALAEGKSNA
jgi:hypothetical protein